MIHKIITYVEVISNPSQEITISTLLQTLGQEGACGVESANGFDCLCGIYRSCYGRGVPEGRYDPTDPEDWAYIDSTDSNVGRLKFVSSQRWSEGVLTMISNYFCEPNNDAVLSFFSINEACDSADVGFCDYSNMSSKSVTISNDEVREQFCCNGEVDISLLHDFLNNEARSYYKEMIAEMNRARKEHRKECFFDEPISMCVEVYKNCSEQTVFSDLLRRFSNSSAEESHQPILENCARGIHTACYGEPPSPHIESENLFDLERVHLELGSSTDSTLIFTLSSPHVIEILAAVRSYLAHKHKDVVIRYDFTDAKCGFVGTGFCDSEKVHEYVFDLEDEGCSLTTEPDKDGNVSTSEIRAQLKGWTDLLWEQYGNVPLSELCEATKPSRNSNYYSECM